MERIEISILDRDYLLACRPSEKERLEAAAKLIQERTEKIQDSGKIAGNERIAVMAAIQTAVELLAMKAPDGPLSNVQLGDYKNKINELNRILDQAKLPSNR